MSDLRINNNNNNASEQDLILAAKRAAAANPGAKLSPGAQARAKSLHLSHQHLGAPSGGPLISGQPGGGHHHHHHHHHTHGQPNQNNPAATMQDPYSGPRQHFASHQQLASIAGVREEQQQQQANSKAPNSTQKHHHSSGQLNANAQIAIEMHQQQKSASSNLIVAASALRNKQQQQLDRSDSASLPSSGGSSASTSDSMFKRRRRLGSSKWQGLLACCCCGFLSAAGSSADSNGQPGGPGSGAHHGSVASRKKNPLTPVGLLLLLLALLAGVLLLSHFRLFGFSISCNFYGANTAASKQIDAYNMKNGPEYYMGITEMLQAMDNTIDPCTDFYNYACGAWTKRHSIPGDESRIDTFSVMRTDLGNKLKDLLEDALDPSDSEATNKAKTLYRSCINEPLIDKRQAEPLLRLLNEQFGGWPLLGLTPIKDENNNNNGQDQANSTIDDWVRLMAILRTYNNEIIIGQTVGSHEHNSSMHAIRLYPAGLGLPSADYYNSSSRQFKAYEKYLISTAQLLGANNSNLLGDIHDVLEFETGLANISKPFERQGGATYHRMSIARLQKYTPAIDWDTYFRYAFPDVAINSTEQVGLYGLDFFMDIAHLINTTTSKKTVINYLLWRFVMNRVNNLGTKFADNQHEYAAEISGAKVQAPRHKVCVDYVNGNMGMAVSSLYVKRHFDAGSKAQAEIMIANIRQAFLEILQQVDWMDSETRQEAIVKAKSMLQHIGFPLWIIDPPALDQEYLHLNFSSEHYFENVIQLIQSFAKETRSKLRQPSERDKWTVAPSIINAHYLRTKNLMSFPAGILQPPIYHTRYPKSLNYGGIGSIIGHEITHGFDNDGRHHDYQGNQRLWWHPNTIDRFIIRSQCMVRQYDDYSVEIRGENITVSGIRTLGENIADNGGLKEAFMAYRKYEQENGPEDLLPGLNLTHHQMFFIKFAQNWCQNMTPQSMMNALKTWRHPLGKFRVIGTLSNLNEFSTAFSCPQNSPMNPANKCKVW